MSPTVVGSVARIAVDAMTRSAMSSHVSAARTVLVSYAQDAMNVIFVALVHAVYAALATDRSAPIVVSAMFVATVYVLHAEWVDVPVLYARIPTAGSAASAVTANAVIYRAVTAHYATAVEHVADPAVPTIAIADAARNL